MRVFTIYLFRRKKISFYTWTESGDNLSSSERLDTGDASDDFDGRQICLLVIGIL